MAGVANHLTDQNTLCCCGSAPSQVNPLTGRGPAWANSLFEDNAQFGLGISMGLKQRRASYAAAVQSLVADKEGPGSPELRSVLEEWLQVRRWGRGAILCFAQHPAIKKSTWLMHPT